MHFFELCIPSRIFLEISKSISGWMLSVVLMEILDDVFKALDYYDIIKQPMDLATVLEKINTYEYEDALQCVDDLKLIFTNSKTYNLVSHSKVV